MRFVRPITQAVGDHLDDPNMAEVERVASAGVVDVVARLVGHQPVIGRVVDPFEGQGRPELVAFGGVVVDDVEDHLQPGIVKTRHHFLEFAQRLLPLMRVTRIGGKETDGIIAPVVGQPLVEQQAVIDKGVNGKELDRGHAERLDVVDHLVGKALVGAAPFRRQVGMELGVLPRHEPADGLTLPVEIGVDDDAFGHEGRAVALVEGGIVARFQLVAEHRRIPFQIAEMTAGIRIQHELVGIEAVAAGGLVGSVHAVPVNRAGVHLRDVAVPDLVGIFGQLSQADPYWLGIWARHGSVLHRPTC